MALGGGFAGMSAPPPSAAAACCALPRVLSQGVRELESSNHARDIAMRERDAFERQVQR